MKQIFKGIFVEFHEPLENFKAHLMDFSDKDQFHFFIVFHWEKLSIYLNLPITHP